MIDPVRLLTLAALFATPLGAQQVIRGPYLQIGTPNSIVVRWRTDLPTDSCVRFGSDAAKLDKEAKSKGKTTEHVMIIEGLKPSTKYHYIVGNTEKAFDGVAGHFITSPPPGTRPPIRAWVVGDAGTASSKSNAGSQGKVRDAYYTFNGARHTDLFLQLGDNAYLSGTDDEYQVAVFDTYKDLLRQTVTWPTLGNHDALYAKSITQSGVYYDVFTLPTLGQAGGLMSGTEAYYSYDYGNIHFVCLDSEGSDRKPGGTMLTWLQSDLGATTQDWIIVYFHHPPYTKGSHDSNTGRPLVEMRQYALPIMEAAGVDLCLTGHSHVYERSFLIDGHYGVQSTFSANMQRDAGDGRIDGQGAYHKPTPARAAHEGAVYVVAGSSGQTTRKTEAYVARGFLDHPAFFVSLNSLGSLVIDVNGSRLDATFIAETGEKLDYFTITKGNGPRLTAR